ncbi:thioredoxin-dependent thiol peroxidase [Populibacterium corticicola]|uniref:thioredoxin-dependent peroxiredoxin n=1 Tax=Populibacterium corticicola TaxID=1812826 RepID=A0ABW5XHC2_9MICO
MRLESGMQAPEFTLEDASGTKVALSDYAGKKVIIYFYPAASTPGCTKQACDFRDSLNSLKSAGYTVLGISPDAPGKLANFTDTESLNFPVLSDKDHAVATAYDAYGEKKNYGRTYLGIIRSTFILNEDHAVEHALYNVRATGHVSRIRKILGLDA